MTPQSGQIVLRTSFARRYCFGKPFTATPNAAHFTRSGHESKTGFLVPGGLGVTVTVLDGEAQNATVAG